MHMHTTLGHFDLFNLFHLQHVLQRFTAVLLRLY